MPAFPSRRALRRQPQQSVTNPPASFGGGFDRLLQALGNATLEQQPVDNNLDGVILAPVERNGFVKRTQLAIDARAQEAILREFLEFLPVLALAAAHDRRENHNAVVRFEGGDCLHDLLGAIGGQWQCPQVGAVRRADGAIDHAQVIVNLSDGTDSGARRASGGFLLDGDGGRKPSTESTSGRSI